MGATITVAPRLNDPLTIVIKSFDKCSKQGFLNVLCLEIFPTYYIGRQKAQLRQNDRTQPPVAVTTVPEAATAAKKLELDLDHLSGRLNRPSTKCSLLNRDDLPK